jgi:hypothetical protein
MGYLGYKPADKPLTSADITDGIITGNDIASTFNLTGKTVTLPAGTGGKVLQVVQATTATSSETSSTSFVTTGLSASITPSSTSNKILVMCSFAGGNNNGATYVELQHIYTLYRGATDLGAASSKGFDLINYYTTAGNAPILYSMPVAINYLDSPSTTSSTTYAVYFRVNNASYGAQFCRNNSTATIILMEIAG